MSQTLDTSHSLAEWLEHILSLHPSEIDLGLQRLRQVAGHMDLLSLPASTIITVAGTNGKGTSRALLERLLLANGYSVGVFSSPHIERYNERVRLNGQELVDAQHIVAFAQIAAAQQATETSLTFFEYSTLGALWLFAQHQPQVVILEVGLGGRLDATNLLAADLALITTIDLDHQDYLGDTRELVGREKAGIMRPNTPAVCGDPNPPNSLLQHAIDSQTPLVCRNRDFSVLMGAKHWSLISAHQCWMNLPLPHIPVDNAAAVLMGLNQLSLTVSDQSVREALSALRVPGRLEPLATNLLVDVAHNPQSARYLANWVAKQPAKRVWAVCSMLADKDMRNSIEPMLPLITGWFTAPLQVPRAATMAQLQQLLPQATCFNSIAEAVAEAWAQASDDDLVIVFGSFYTVAQAKQYWQQRG
ncbi:MAG: bifunctional tetrahydrofolate synthase/dihydrofolate synthase [Ferrimonas sp.]